MSALLVVLGAAVGAPLRHLVDRAVQGRHTSGLPWGTFVVNVGGSLVLGLVIGLAGSAGAPGWLRLLVGTGFCGALTTYSTFSYETVRLAEQGQRRAALANVALSIGAGLAATGLGAALGAAL